MPKEFSSYLLIILHLILFSAHHHPSPILWQKMVEAICTQRGLYLHHEAFPQDCRIKLHRNTQLPDTGTKPYLSVNSYSVVKQTSLLPQLQQPNTFYMPESDKAKRTELRL